MTCEHCGPLLSLYHDGMLEPKQREEVRAHLHSCPTCAARLARYRQMDEQIAGALRIAPSPRFSHAVLTATSTTAGWWATSMSTLGRSRSKTVGR